MHIQPMNAFDRQEIGVQGVQGLNPRSRAMFMHYLKQAAKGAKSADPSPLMHDCIMMSSSMITAIAMTGC